MSKVQLDEIERVASYLREFIVNRFNRKCCFNSFSKSKNLCFSVFMKCTKCNSCFRVVVNSSTKECDLVNSNICAHKRN